MNIIWTVIIISSLLYSMFSGTVSETVSAAFSGASGSVNTVISMMGAFCFWTGMLKISEKSGMTKKISKAIRPILKRLFPKAREEAFSDISMNVVSNLLGLGNAATPSGIKAMSELDKENEKETPSKEMCRFILLNTSSIQLIPTTIMSLRAAAESVNPAEIIVPVWITSFTALIFALCFFEAFNRIGRWRK